MNLKIIDGKLHWKGIDQVLLEGKWFPLSEKDLDNLEWAKEFMDKYELRLRQAKARLQSSEGST